MKKTILTIGILLMSASALANHTTGLKQHQGQVAASSGKSVTINGKAPIIPQAHVNRARETNVVTDPQSCSERWGDHCAQPEQHDPAVLDLGEISIEEQIVPADEGESIESILTPVEVTDGDTTE